MKRLLFFGTTFLLLTVLGSVAAVWLGGVDGRSVAAARAVPPWSLATAVGMAVALVLAEVFRFWVFGWALGLRLSFRACLDATVANNFFAWLTPGAALADPAAIYVLHRHGVAPELGAILAFGKGATGFCLMLSFTAIGLLLGYGPPLNAQLAAFFAWGALFGAGLLGLLWMGAFAPESAHRAVRWLEHRVARLPWNRLKQACQSGLRASARAIEHLATFPWSVGRVASLLGSHLLYIGCFMGVLLALTSGFGAPVLEVLPRALIFQTFTYILPTPGGAGLSEAASTTFLGDLLSPDAAVLAVLLFRALTFHAHVGLGLLYLPAIGVLGGILKDA